MIRQKMRAARAGLLALFVGSAAFVSSHVAVTATYRESTVVPPIAAPEARVEAADPGTPAYSFRTPRDSTVIDHQRTYAANEAGHVGNGGQPRGPDAPVWARTAQAQTGDGGGGGEAETADGADAADGDPSLLRGFVTFTADGAHFTDCATGRAYLIAEQGDFTALEHAYVAAGGEPGGPVMASFEGEVGKPQANAESVVAVVRVARFVGIWADEVCDPPAGNRPLAETRWQMLRLGDTDLEPHDGRPPPHLLLEAGNGRQFSTSVGCNTHHGSFELEGKRLVFGPVAATLMACPPPLAALEQQLGEVLASVRGWRIEGDRLDLLDAEGGVIAVFEATEPA